MFEIMCPFGKVTPFYFLLACLIGAVGRSSPISSYGDETHTHVCVCVRESICMYVYVCLCVISPAVKSFYAVYISLRLVQQIVSSNSYISSFVFRISIYTHGLEICS